MIVIDHTILSDDVVEKLFVCHIEKCKAACCVEGDAGAPLEPEETTILEQELDNIKPFLTAEGLVEIEKQGAWVIDVEGDQGTPILETKECAYAIRNEKGILACGIEKAWEAGATTFRKPISCHLYPIRIKKYDQYQALNYHHWDICAPACSLGKELGIPVYKFLKDALTRKYGQVWYEKLEAAAADVQQNNQKP